MILKHSVVNEHGNRIEKGEEVQILSTNSNGEVYIYPMKRTSNGIIGLWVPREAVE